MVEAHAANETFTTSTLGVRARGDQGGRGRTLRNGRYRALHMQSHVPEQSQPGRAAAEKILMITASIA